jgi:hypothetical protein
MWILDVNIAIECADESLMGNCYPQIRRYIPAISLPHPEILYGAVARIDCLTSIKESHRMLSIFKHFSALVSFLHP